MKSCTVIFTLLGLLSTTSAHMHMSDPPCLRGKENHNVPPEKVDSDTNTPLHGDGSNFPCKGYQSDLGTPLGASVADWSAGSTQSMSIVGGASHSGGSCQVSLSYDKGKSFTAIHSYIGDCPTSSGGTFPFTVPADAPSGAALFAWTWFNNVGNREMYMNCASVTIKGSGIKKRASASFSSRPSILVANLNNGCKTSETSDVIFPNPGPDVTDVSKSKANLIGQCQPVSGIGGGGSAPASVPASAPASAQPSSPVKSIQSSSMAASAMVPASSHIVPGASSAMVPSYTLPTSQSSGPAMAPSSTPSAQGGSSPSAGGSCGGQVSCLGSVHGSCCSQWGYCGSTPAHCGAGCQSALGTCGTSTTGSSGLQVSTDKSCGPSTSNTCQGSSYGNCCSQYGYCGSTSDYCGTGCQSGFGTCGLASGPSSPSASLSSMANTYNTASVSSANPAQSAPSKFLTMVSTRSSASAVTVIPVRT